MSREYREASDETREKMSAAKQGNLNPNYGKPRDANVRRAISQGLKDYWATVPSKNGNSNIVEQVN